MSGPWEQYQPQAVQQPPGPWTAYQQPEFAPVRAAQGVADAFVAGWQNSASGYIARGKLPDVVLDPQHATWYEKLIASGAQLAADTPEMIAGAIGGGAAGGAIGSAVPIVGNVAGAAVGAGAGAFALPTAIRESYIQALTRGEVTSTADFLDRASIVLKHTGKDALIGGLTGGAGRLAEVAAAPLLGEKVLAGSLSAGAARAGTETAKLGAEYGTLVVAPAALEGRMPEPQDFLNTAIMLLGLKAAGAGAARLREIYARTGKTPMEVAADAKQDPTIIEDLAKPLRTEEAVAVPPKPMGGAKLEWENNDQAVYQILDATGRPVGSMQLLKRGDFALQIHNVGIDVPDAIGQGYGVKAYTDVVDASLAQGKQVWSDSDVSRDAMRMYDALERRGYVVERNPNAVITEDTYGLHADRGPVFKITGKREIEPKASDLLAEYGPEIPRAYEPLAREQAARDAVPDPSPEAARAFVEKPFAEVPQLPGEPVLPTHVNYNYLNTTADVQQALSRLSQLYEQRIVEAKRDTVSWEQTYQEARALFEQTTGEKVAEAPTDANYKALAADLYAQKQLLISGAEQLMQMRSDYVAARAEGKETPEMKLGLLAQIERVAQAQAATRGSQAEVGRALNVLKSTNRDKAYYDELNSVISSRFAVEGKLGDKNFDRMVDAMGDLGSPREALTFADRAARATTWDKVMEAWKAGLVSGPFTQIANIMGNATFMATRPLVDTVASVVSLMRSGPDRVRAVEPLARIVGNIQGVMDGAKAFAAILRQGQAGRYETVKTGTPPAAPGTVRYYHGGRPEASNTGPLWFTSDLRDAQGWAGRSQDMQLWYVDVPADHPARGGDPTFGVLPPTRMELPGEIASQRQVLEPAGEKRVFVPDMSGGKVESRRNAIEGTLGDVVRVPFRLLSAADAFFRVANERGEAYALASREAAGEGFNPATREFRERVVELATNPTQTMEDAISAAGQRFTFNTPLGEKGQAVQQVVRKLHLEWAVPFVQTPANIAKEMLRLTPAAPIIGEWRDAIAKGGAARDQAIAEMALGTSVGVAVFSMALSGQISGQGDPDPKKRAVQMASGWQPYSVKIGDKWYSYQRLQPVGTLIGMSADMASVWQHMTPEESDKVPKILATAFANAITNQTFLQGVTNIVNAISDPGRFGPKFVQGLAASTVPAVVGQTATMMDPYQREIDSVKDAVLARVPGVRQDLLPKRDPYGEPIPAKDRMGEISPITVSRESDDKVRKEAARLGVGVAKAPQSIELPAGHDKKLGQVKLTPEQQDVFASEAGHLAYHVLDQIVNQPTWDNMPDMVQRNAMNMVFEKSRAAGRAAAVSQEQMAREANRISNELRDRLAREK